MEYTKNLVGWVAGPRFRLSCGGVFFPAVDLCFRVRQRPYLHHGCEVGRGIEQPREPHTLWGHQILRPRAELCDASEHVHELAK